MNIFKDKSLNLIIILSLIALCISLADQARGALPDVLSSEMLSAMARVESNCSDPKYMVGDDAMSIGKFQVQVATANGLGFNLNRNDLFNDFINETVARAYLLKLMIDFGDNERTLIAYNCGPKIARTIKLPARCVKIIKASGKKVPSCGCYIQKIKKALLNPCI